MRLWQTYLLIFFSFYAFFSFVKGFIESRKKKNPFGLCPLYNLLGAFVWGDALAFGVFWFGFSLVCIFLNDFLLFVLGLSVFWVVRSLSEVIYWLSEQFSSKTRNPPENLWLNKIFPGEAVWFGMQIFWQCVSVIAIIFSIYFASLWLRSFN